MRYELLFVAMALKFLTHLGMLPNSFLWERSKIWSEVRAQSPFKMWPWKLFEQRLRVIKLRSLCHIHEGMDLANSFSLRSIITNSSQFFKDDGNLFESLLLCRCRDLRRVNGPMDVGMLLMKLLFPKFMVSNLFHIIQQSCIFPDKRFFPCFWAHSSCNTKYEK